MKRDLLKNLIEWKKSNSRKPLILRGARQVGKSWLVRELGKEFNSFIEINFEKNNDFCALFEKNLNVKEIIINIKNYFGQEIIENKTLIFFDEIQICPKAIVALRYFYEDLPDLYIIAAGSLLEFELENISVPVGRVSFIYVKPLSFGEFLVAQGKEHLRNLLLNKKDNSEPLNKLIHDQLIKEVKNYTLIGGMPEVVKEFINSNHNYNNCIQIQSDLIETYKSDFKKYAKKHQIKYLELILNSSVIQLGAKFKYSKVSKEIKSRDLSNALELLEMAGLLHKVYHSSSNGIPLKAEINIKKFKLLFFDIGLALRLLDTDYKNLVFSDDITLINSGAIAELFTGLELLNYQDFRRKAELFYWHRESSSSNAEIDFVIQKNNSIIPIEVKSNLKGNMKSLKIFMEEKKSQFGLKISNFPYSYHDDVKTIPFYGIEGLIT